MFKSFLSALEIFTRKGQKLYEAIQSNNSEEVSSILNGWFKPNYSQIRPTSIVERISPLSLAFRNKRIFRNLILNYADQIPKLELEKAIQECINIDLPEFLIEVLSCFPGFEPDQLFLEAARSNASKTINFLISNFPASIRSKHIFKAIQASISREDTEVNDLLLRRCIYKVSKNDLKALLQYAVENQKIHFLKFVVENFSHKISKSTSENLVLDALRKGAINIVAILLNLEHTSDAHIIMQTYIQAAKEFRDLGVYVDILGGKYGALFSPEDKGLILKLSAVTSPKGRELFRSLLSNYGHVVNDHDKCVAIKISEQIDELYSIFLQNHFEWSLNSVDCLLRHTAFGHSEIIQVLLEHYSERFDVCSKVDSLKVAIEKKNSDVVCILLENILKSGEQEIAFKLSVDKKYDDVFQFLFTHCENDISLLEYEGALKIAAYRGCEAAVELLLDKRATDMNDFNLRLAYMISEENGHQSISEMISRYTDLSSNMTDDIFLELADKSSDALSHSPKSNLISFMSEETNDERICNHFKARHIATVTLFKEQYASSTDFRKDILFKAAQFGCEPIFKHMFSGLRTDGVICAAFELAASAGSHNIVDFLLSEASSQFWNPTIISNAFKEAASNGHHKVVERLLERFSQMISGWDKASALLQSICGAHSQTVHVLLDEPSIAQTAHFNNNSMLDNARFRLNGTAPDSEERARYEDIIGRLLRIPAVRSLDIEMNNAELDLGRLTQFDENSMRSMSEKQKQLVRTLAERYGQMDSHKSWHEIRPEILNYLKREYLLSPALDGYHGVWMLPADCHRIPADFIPADTIGLHIQGENCTLYWRDFNDTMNQKILPSKEVIELYKFHSMESWLYQYSQDRNLLEALLIRYGVPAHPKQDHVLPLEYVNGLHQSALVAYYRHRIHNAWRYLSDTNPWMSATAAFVDNTQNHAIISDFDKCLIAYFWIAVNDQDAILDCGFTMEGNKIVFAHTVGEINRGHNIDKRAVYSEDQFNFTNGLVENIETTCTDNLMPDTPSCSYGVTQRLLESNYGHPYTQDRTLNFNNLLKWMDAHLLKKKQVNDASDNLLDRIENLPVRLLKAIQQHISDSLDLYEYEPCEKIHLSPEESEQISEALSFSKEQMRSFFIQLYDYFGQDVLESCPNEKSILKDQDFSSYSSFVQYCAENPLSVFSEAIYRTVKNRIKELEVDVLFSSYSGTKKRKKYDRDNNQSPEEEPPRKQRKPN
ncbi:MAG: hypothetical protein U1E78_08180 [Gammaproteobacteria bacterium]